MVNLLNRLLHNQSNRGRPQVVRKVKHTDKPALTKATQGTVILRGKIEEDFKMVK